MTNLILHPNKLCEALPRQQRTLRAAVVAAFTTVHEGIVHKREQLNPKLSGRIAQSVAFNLLRRFRQYVDAVLRFISDSAVPFTNNVAERAVRMS